LSKILITADQKVRQLLTHLFIRAVDSIHRMSSQLLVSLVKLVELTGIEPTTRRVAAGVPHLRRGPCPRTPRSVAGSTARRLVELTGIEPATYGLQSRRSPS
jgi:hypothetical protein